MAKLLLLVAFALALSAAAAATPSASLRRTKAHAEIRKLLQHSQSACGCGLHKNQYATSCPDAMTPDGRLAYCNDCKSHLGDPAACDDMPMDSPNVPDCTHETCQSYHPKSNYLPTQRATSGRYRTKGSCGWFKSGSWWKIWMWYKGCDSGYSCDSGTCTDNTRMEGESCSEKYKCIQPNEHSKQICYKDGKCHRLTDGIVKARDQDCTFWDNVNPFSESPCHQHICIVSTGDGEWKCDWNS